MPAITELPPAPSRANPVNFSAMMDAFLAALALFQVEVNAVGADISAEMQAAIDDFNAAIGGFYPGTSTTSAACTLGTKIFTTQGGLGYRPGTFVTIAYAAAPHESWLFGVVRAYNTSTGSMTVDVQKVGPVLGTFSAWNLNISGPPGADGTVTTGEAFALAHLFGG